MAIFFASLLGSAAILLIYTLYDLNQRAFVREVSAVIKVQADHYAVRLAGLDAQARKSEIEAAILPYGQTSQTYLALIDPVGNVLAGNLDVVPPSVDLTPISPDIVRFDLKTPDEPSLMRRLVMKVITVSDNQTLWVAQDISQIRDSYRIVNWLIVCILFFLLVVILTSFYISTFVVRRINDISNTAQRIMATGDLSQRIAIDSTWDDLGNMAALLNLFLERLEVLMQAVRDVSDNIAHDLRTPLTRLRNRIETSKAKAHQWTALDDSKLHHKGAVTITDLSDDFSHDMDELLVEADQLLGIFNAILRLTNLEKGRRTQPFVSVAVHDVLSDVAELYQALAEDKGIQLELQISDQCFCSGDRNLLFQVLANLLDNAVKFTPADGRIMVELAAISSKSENNQYSCCITIADSGAGIPPEEREKVFDRFYRADRSRQTPGSGLGLSLVRAAVELHGGSVRLEDNAPGLKCLIFL